MKKFSIAILAMIMAIVPLTTAFAEFEVGEYYFDFSDVADNSSKAPVRDVELCYATADSSEFTRVTRTLGAETLDILIGNVLSESLVGNSYIDISGGFHTSSVPAYEFSCGTLTVDLPADVLGGRSEQELFIAENALANTLLALDEITAVNILFGHRAAYLYEQPIGALTEPIESAILLYADLEARQSALLNPNETFSCSALIYHPTGSGYLLPSVTKVTSDAENWGACLLKELNFFPVLLESSYTLETTDQGEHMIAIDLKTMPGDISIAELCGSITLTLTSFVPDIARVRITQSGAALTSIEMPDGTTLQIEDSCMTRDMFAGMIGSSGTIYLKNPAGRLSPAAVTMGSHDCITPTGLLRVLFQTPSFGDLTTCVPEGISPRDILSVRCSGRSVIVDLSANFYTRCQDLDEAGERQLAYAMINTLCSLPEIDSACFTIEGTRIDRLTHSIRLSSNLMPDPGIVDK